MRGCAGTKNGVVARWYSVLCSSKSSVKTCIEASVMVSFEVAGGVMPEKGRKRGVIPSNSIPGVEGPPRPPHRLFFVPPVAVDDPWEPWLVDPC